MKTFKIINEYTMRCHYRQVIEIKASSAVAALKKFDDKGDEAGVVISDDIYESTHIDVGDQEPFVDEDWKY
jgi:hypothetical protein